MTYSSKNLNKTIPFFSIITITYNSERYLKDCIESLKAQTFKNIEHILVDSNSTDNTLKIIEDYINEKNDYKIYLIKNSNSGIYDSINLGISHTSGAYIGLLHSDDFFANNYVLENIYNNLKEFKYDGCYGNIDFVSKNDKNKIIRTWQSSKFKKYKLYFGWMPPHTSLFLHKSVFERYGLYDVSFKIASDYEFILRIFKKEELNILFLPITITRMRLGGMSVNYLTSTLEDCKALIKHNFFPFVPLFFKKISKIFQYF